MLDFVKSAFAPRYTFENADTILIRGRQYRYISTHGDSHYFVPADGQGPREKYENATIAEMLETGHFDHRPDREFSYLTELSPHMLTLLSDEEKQRASEREAIVLAAFEKYQAGDLKRTDASIRKNSDSILGAATRMLNTYDAETNSLKMPSPRTLRRWMSAYEKVGLAALYDNVSQRGNYGRKLSEEQRFFMYSKLPGYLTELKKTPANIVKDVRNAFTAENEKRKGEGRTDLLECPSRVTILAAIHHLAPFRVKLAREGVDAAMRAFSPVGEGIDVERPLQRVEMDEQKIDLISLMEDSGLLQMMTDDEKAQLGLDGKSGRWWMTVLLDVRTRCMLGMILSRTPSSKSGLRALEMAMRDKGAWLDAQTLDQATRATELLGVLVARGPAQKLPELTSDDWDHAGRVGFQFTSRGEEGIREALEAQFRKFDGATGTPGARKIFGCFYNALAHSKSLKEPGDIARILRNVITENIAMPAGTTVLGVELPERRLYTVASLAKEQCLDSRTLSNVLVAAGAIPERAPAHFPIPVDKGREIAGHMKRTVSVISLWKDMDFTRPIIDQLFYDRLLTPIYFGKPGLKGRTQKAVDCEEVAMLVGKLHAKAVELDTETDGLVPVSKAAEKAKVPAITVVHMILGGFLERVFRLAGQDGVAALRVDPVEIKQHRSACSEGSSPTEAFSSLKISKTIGWCLSA
ncbi:helix-turn-helix domain-containing protein [Rhodovulum sulfidophilum]|uniref:helix-turn-helix domain-containing protein n=1 Tax=Rhodovulum sulfidophilum TaxID=35806 RepID=UPI001920FCC8|nr:helix-turn-helix domain-containing protein [Rhodovulum sulfidophilum]MBL3562929.1 helix-turn-helix domain-containing protein [Rhodovulum sulfidophilum]